MGGQGRKLLPLAVAMLLGTTGGLVRAEGRAPTVSAVELQPVWGTVYKLSAHVHAAKGAVTAAEYRIGDEVGTLYAADGLLDSDDELVETYVDLGTGGGEPLALRAQAAGAWTDWQDVPHGGGDQPAVEGCALQSERPGRAGWFRGPVTVDCTGLKTAETAATIAYSIDFGDWIPADAVFTVADEGVHWIQVRTQTEDGVEGLPNTFTVAIDTTAPTLRLTPPAASRLTHADQLELDFAADDDLSGVDVVVANLDEEQELTVGSSMDLWQLPLGWHTVSVYARDQAGNVAQSAEPIGLEITVDEASLAKLVQLFSASGKLDWGGVKQRLVSHLSAAQAAKAAGHGLDARAELSEFVSVVQDGVADGSIFADAGTVLVADANYLISQVDDGFSTSPPDFGHEN